MSKPQIRWGRTILGWPWLWHAVDLSVHQPIGCYKAQCGHLLLEITELQDQPLGKACETCAGEQYNQATEGGSP